MKPANKPQKHPHAIFLTVGIATLFFRVPALGNNPQPQPPNAAPCSCPTEEFGLSLPPLFETRGKCASEKEMTSNFESCEYDPAKLKCVVVNETSTYKRNCSPRSSRSVCGVEILATEKECNAQSGQYFTKYTLTAADRATCESKSWDTPEPPPPQFYDPNYTFLQQRIWQCRGFLHDRVQSEPINFNCVPDGDFAPPFPPDNPPPEIEYDATKCGPCTNPTQCTTSFCTGWILCPDQSIEDAAGNKYNEANLPNPISCRWAGGVAPGFMSSNGVGSLDLGTMEFFDIPTGASISPSANLISLTNTGGTSVQGFTITVSSPFVILSNTCPTTVPPAATCAIKIGVQPQNYGPVSGSATLTYRGAPAKQIIALAANLIRSADSNTCGDGIVQPGELCDLGNANGQPNSGCSLSCQTVATPGYYYHNPKLAQDVNNDGIVSPLDALILINYINNNLPTTLTPPKTTSVPPPLFYDVVPDGQVNTKDVLNVINYLNSH